MTPPLYLRCSCRCKANVFRVGPVNQVTSNCALKNDLNQNLVSDNPLSFLKCHCRSCRAHSSSAFGVYMSKVDGRCCKANQRPHRNRQFDGIQISISRGFEGQAQCSTSRAYGNLKIWKRNQKWRSVARENSNSIIWI